MKKLYRIGSMALAVCAALACLTATGCSGSKEEVIIFTSAEEYRVEYLRDRLTNQFPEYKITIDYKDTGTHSAKLLAEGKETECDITYDLEYSYLEKLASEGVLADISGYDTSIYAEDTITGKYYLPEVRNGGAIILNPEVLTERNLPKPESYADLLKPEYAGMISMPNPKSSGTGYMFLKALVNSMGEEEAFTYFDGLAKNISSFTSSGSGPVNALVQKEAAIGLGMTAQAVTAINDGTKLEIVFFEEGSPFSMYGQAIISGKETRECVKKVFDFMINTCEKETNEKFYPELIYKTGPATVKNFPENVSYCDMSGSTISEKERLLEKWKY